MVKSDDLLTPRPIRDQESVWRAILSPGKWNPQKKYALSGAFLLRKGEKGLSVNTTECESCKSFRDSFNRGFAVFDLQAVTVRALNLDVIRTSRLRKNCHSLITGLPLPDEDTFRAESLANALARIASFAC